MPFLGNIANIVARKSWSDLGKLLREMQAEIAALRTANTLAYSTLSAGGSVIVDGGVLTVLYNGTPLCKVGTDGTVVGLRTFRPNGQQMLSSLGQGFQGFTYTAVYDGNGDVVLADNPVGAGLLRPRLSVGSWVDNTALGTPAQPTTSSTFVTLQTLFGYQQNPYVRVDAIVSSSAADTTGEVIVTDPSGTQIGSTLTVAANTVAVVTLGPVALPSFSLGSAGYYSLQARRTAGTGTVGVRGLGMWGGGASDTN